MRILITGGCGFLGRRLARVPALVLATYRDEELAGDHPLRMVLGDLATLLGSPLEAPDGLEAGVSLGQLSEDQARALSELGAGICKHEDFWLSRLTSRRSSGWCRADCARRRHAHSRP